MQYMKTKITYISIIVAASTLLAYVYVMNNEWFGKGDIVPFLIYSTIMAILSSSASNIYNNQISKFNAVFGFVAVLIISIVQTVIFTYLLWFVIGPWTGAISFPFQIFWLTAITLANLYLLVNSENKFGKKHFGISILISTILISLFYLANRIKDAKAQTQNFDIFCITHRLSDKTPNIDELFKYNLTGEESKAIIETGIKGSFWTDKYFRIVNSKLISTDNPNYDYDQIESTPGSEIEFRFGNTLDSLTNKRNKIILVMNHPIEKDFTFNEPLNSSMIAIQNIEDDTWEITRLNNETNSKKITVEKTNFSGFPYSTSIILDLKGRDEFSLHGFQWLERKQE